MDLSRNSSKVVINYHGLTYGGEDHHKNDYALEVDVAEG